MGVVALYFFHLLDGSDLLLDPEGRNVARPETIAGIALDEARSLISHEAREGRIDLDQRIEVRDAHGSLIHTVEFADAVQIIGGSG
jgi:hypothetical protein